MAVEMMGGALLSSFLQVLFDRLASHEVLDFIQGRKLDNGLLNKLNITLLSINALLNDAEEKQITDPAVKEWLNKLRDAIYDAEDLLDDIATEASSQKLEAEFQSITSKISSFFSSSIINQFEKGTKEVLDILEFLVKQKHVLNLKESVSGTQFRKSQSTSLAEESSVYGRDADKQSIVKLLLTDDADGKNISVIPIVGMAGVGKTTLAQLVYNDAKVNEFFNIKAWVCVSQESDVFRVTKTILEAIPFPCETMDLNQLQVKLKEFLSKKKFLIGLDDVWNENYIDWELLRCPFEFGAPGSKIIVTTRSKHVAEIMHTVPHHNLKQLGDDDCWLLFAKHAFENGNFSAHPTLAAFGREIVKKCKGLPLAAKALAGLLRSKVDPKYWHKVLTSNIWDFSNNRSNILPALMFCLLFRHLYLPSPLKHCFAYCSIFPKNFRFKRDELVHLWMAEDLLLDSERNGNMEEVGVEYFNDLVARSFFQRSRTRRCFIMHDLVNDLAKFVFGEFSFRLEGDKPYEMSKRIRHLSYSNVEFDSPKVIGTICEAKGLRTFLPSELSSRSRCLTDGVVNNILSALKSLRAVSLSHSLSLSALPNSIGNLVHLRYLDLSHTAIIKLPDSTCSLHNLQTLLLSYCGNLTELPVNIGRLINLRCLNINGTKLTKMPLEMSRLKNLQILTSFVIGKRSGSGIQELKELNFLKGKLSISKLENVANAKDALEANLKDKMQLDELVLKWSGHADDSQKDRDVLSQLQPPTSLRKLTIEYYGGTKFPDWLGSHIFSSMVSLCLRDCKHCFFLPPLGQLPFLRDLSIVGIDITSVGPEFYGNCSSGRPAFGSLQILRFEKMLEWQDWLEDAQATFPQLKQLHIKNGPKLLKGLPENLPSLTKLVITDCQQLVASLQIVPSITVLQLEHCKKLTLKDLPQRLLKLTISGYDALEYLFEGSDFRNSCIEKVNISKCASLVSLHTGAVVDTIKSLEITNCGKMELPVYPCFASLESLFLSYSCDSLKSFPLDLFPKLNHLSIHHCQNLESLSVFDRHFFHLTSLNYIRIRSCLNFVSFPEGGLSAPNLTCLEIYNCGKLGLLPEQMTALLPSLVNLSIWGCPELESFPEAGLPSSLQSIEVSYCDKLFANRKTWSLESLPYLGSFGIRGECKDGESFPERGILPSTLTSLYILKLQNLKSLDGIGLQHLTSLKNLKIGCCDDLLTMPEESLPRSLSDLHIWNCPLLKERCQREKGEDWPKIAYIPRIRMDRKLIKCA